MHQLEILSLVPFLLGQRYPPVGQGFSQDAERKADDDQQQDNAAEQRSLHYRVHFPNELEIRHFVVFLYPAHGAWGSDRGVLVDDDDDADNECRASTSRLLPSRIPSFMDLSGILICRSLCQM